MATPSSAASPPPPHDSSDDTRHAGGENAASLANRDALANNVTLFSTRRPQHVGAGFASGFKNIARGVATGVASLVALPAMGYRQGGVGGAAKGLGAGLISCVALSTAGVATGAFQAVRGIINTPEAVSEARSGSRMWHPEKREWVEVRLPAQLQALPPDDSDLIRAARTRKLQTQQDEEEVTAADPEAGNNPHNSTAATYYEVLEVNRNATTSEIRKAYARAALKHHPDKNQGDPTASDRFKLVGEAYRVLSNEIARSEYDRTGKRESDNSDPADDRRGASASLRSMPGVAIHPLQELLGGEAFLPFIGHLHLCVSFMNDAYSFSKEEGATWYERRCIRIAGHLTNLFSQLISLQRSDGAEAVREVIMRRGNELLNATYGHEISALVAARMHLAADRYKSVANGSLLGRTTSAVEDWRQSASSFATTATTVISTIRQMSSNTRQLTHDDTVPMLFRLSASDIAGTVEFSCDLTLYDLSVSKDERWERADCMTKFADYLLAHASVSQMQSLAPASSTQAPPGASMS